MSVYYTPGLRGFRGFGAPRRRRVGGFGAVMDFGPAIAGGVVAGGGGGGGGGAMIPVTMQELSPDRGGYDEFTGKHRAPAAAPAVFTALYTTAFQQAMTSGPLSSKTDAIQQMVKSGQLQVQTWAGYAAACQAAGGTPTKQADGSMTCVGAPAEVTLGAGFGTQSGNLPVSGGGSAFGSKGGSGSGSVSDAAFQVVCKQMKGTYYSTGPCCALPPGLVDTNGNPVGAVMLDAQGQLVGASSCASAGGGGAAVAMIGGAALLALLLLR